MFIMAIRLFSKTLLVSHEKFPRSKSPRPRPPSRPVPFAFRIAKGPEVSAAAVLPERTCPVIVRAIMLILVAWRSGGDEMIYPLGLTLYVYIYISPLCGVPLATKHIPPHVRELRRGGQCLLRVELRKVAGILRPFCMVG